MLKELAEDQVKAKQAYHSTHARISKQIEAKAASEDQPQNAEPSKDPDRFLLSPKLELTSVPDVVGSPDLQAGASIPDEGPAVDWAGPIQPDLRTTRHSLAKAFSSFSIHEKSVATEYQLAFLSNSSSNSDSTQFYDSGSGEAVRTTPVFSGKVLDGLELETFRQYGLLCRAVVTRRSKHTSETSTSKLPLTSKLPIASKLPLASTPPLTPKVPLKLKLPTSELSDVFEHDPRIFLNVNAPWSTFICGSQGSGKSHTLSCILENCLIQSGLGQLPNPLAAIAFHYDTFTSYRSKQLCEAAYLCSSGVPVKVLVSPTNFWRMKETYENLPILSHSNRKPEVIPLKFQDKHLNVARMMSMMAVSDKDGPVPLYMEVCIKAKLSSQSSSSYLTGNLPSLTRNGNRKSRCSGF